MKLRTNKLLALLLVIVIVFNSADINLISLASDMDNGFNSELILSDDTSNNSIIGNNDPAPDDGYSVTYSYNIPNYKVSDKIAKKLLNSYKNKDIKLPKLSSKGYTFLGWFIDDIKISKISKNNVLCKGNITVEARFAYKPSKVKNTIKPGVSGNIIIDYDGGTSKKTLSSNGLNLNKSVKLPKPKKEGYKFLGWFVGNTKVTKLDYKLDVCMPYNNGETLTCKAKWTPSEVTIKFNKNGSKTKGKIAPYVTYVNAITILPECTLVKDNLKFSYWSTKKKGVGISIPNSGFKINKLGIKLKKTLKLYANYSEEGLKKDDSADIKSFDLSNLSYNTNGDWYVIDSVINSLSGTISNCKEVDSISYEIKDAWGNKVKNGNIDVNEKIIINNIGLIIGYNEMVVTIDEKNGKVRQEKYSFFNFVEENQKNTDVDFSDTDGDGVDNYFENIMGTDPLKIDTDGDTLTDYQEIYLTGTNPLMKKTSSNVDNLANRYWAGNSITDADLDSDNDGLTNKEELEKGTLCNDSDTDNDGLTDGDEVKKYNTFPTYIDSDEDGLLDGEEIELGFDPRKSDTDDNGIRDIDEVLYQKNTIEVQDTEKGVITSVSIGINCSGYAKKAVNIIETYNIDMHSSKVAGLIGTPLEINIEKEFETIDLTFSYDDRNYIRRLGTTAEENLAIMWYDAEHDKYEIIDSIVDKDNNTVSCKTNHFSVYENNHFATYLLVDKEKWIDSICTNLNRRSVKEDSCYDVAFVLQKSSSMVSTDFNKLTISKEIVNNILDEMVNTDRASLVSFAETTKVDVGLSSDKKDLKNKLNSLYVSGSGQIRPYNGIESGIDSLLENENSNKKIVILIAMGSSIPYDYLMEEKLQKAKENNVVFYCIDISNKKDSDNLDEIAAYTNGKCFAVSSEDEIEGVVESINKDLFMGKDTSDKDEDRLLDVYEVNGMKLSNGEIVYTSSDNKDSNGNGVEDGFEMGYMPITETYTIDGIEYKSEVFHPISSDSLSDEFVYVDGRVNADGSVYNEKMDYVPYNDSQYNEVYVDVNDGYTVCSFETKPYYGSSGIHGLYKDNWDNLSFEKRVGWLTEFKTLDSAIMLVIIKLTSKGNDFMYDYTALDVFKTYISGLGGKEKGLKDTCTRKTIDVSKWFLKEKCINSAFDKYLDNLEKTRKAVESSMNVLNSEMYISTSHKTQWNGSLYWEDSKYPSLSELVDVAFNIAASGTFNKADAGITAHCTYDSSTNEYTMHYKYYLIDFYDYSSYDQLQWQDAVGLARSFELYGVLEDEITWKKGENIKSNIYQDYFIY